MEFNQDQAFNSIHVLSDVVASNRTGSAIFNGGINVKKNIIACEIDSQFIFSKDVKISNELSVQNNIYTDGSILPLTQYSTAQLGDTLNKWNSINCVNTNTQELSSINANLKNTYIENLYLKNNVQDIIDTSIIDISYNIELLSTINIINLNSSIEKTVTINIPRLTDSSINDYKKIIFKQNLCNNIKWSYNMTDAITNNNSNQIIDFINVNGIWELVNYNTTDKQLIEDVSGLLFKYNTIDATLVEDVSGLLFKYNSLSTNVNLLSNQYTALSKFNAFLEASCASQLSILDYVDINNNILVDIGLIKENIITIETQIADLLASLNSNNNDQIVYQLQIDKQVSDISLNLISTNNTVDISFQNINTSLSNYDSQIDNMYVQLSNMNLEIMRVKEFNDIIDTRLCDHITDTDSKMKLLNDKMDYMTDIINTIQINMNL